MGAANVNYICCLFWEILSPTNQGQYITTNVTILLATKCLSKIILSARMLINYKTVSKYADQLVNKSDSSIEKRQDKPT